jgi:thiosulfate dehydrogenase [quinone] large subunit
MSTAATTYRRVFGQEHYSDPGIIKTIFGSPAMAPVWFFIRLYIGYQWLVAGIEKVTNPAWTRTGTALQGFWVNQTKLPAGAKGAVIHYGWYHDFLQYMLNNHWYTWFGPLVAFSETAIGIALILGAFVGVAAFFGAFMNFNFMLAGSASINPVLFGIAILLVLAWKVAGFIGADYYLLPAIGTPWKPGHITAVGHAETRRAPGVGRVVAGVGVFLAVFAVAGVVVVAVANHFLNEQPFAGYFIAAAAVVAAWIVTEVAVYYTHTFGTGEPEATGQMAPHPTA